MTGQNRPHLATYEVFELRQLGIHVVITFEPGGPLELIDEGVKRRVGKEG